MSDSAEKRAFDEKLILEVEAHPSTYCKASKSYANRNQKEQDWQKIANILNTDVKKCKDRWKNLKDTFSKNFKKEKNVPSGSAASNHIQWCYFPIMQFLVPYIEVPKTTGNFESKQNNEEKENEFQDTADMDNEIYSSLIEEIHDSPNRSRSSRKRKNEESECEKFIEALSNLNPPPDSPPLKKFFSALASRASDWSRKKQSRLEILTLQIFHQVEFEEE